jgi:hypothetical protein
MPGASLAATPPFERAALPPPDSVDSVEVSDVEAS